MIIKKAAFFSLMLLSSLQSITMKFEMDLDSRKITESATLNSVKGINEYFFKFSCKDNPSCLNINLVNVPCEDSDFTLNMSVIDETGKVVSEPVLMGKYDNQMKLSVNSNSGRNLDLKCTVTKSYDINDWTLVDFDTYLKENASKLEQSSNELQELKTRHDKIIVMCDSTGDIAEFYGKEIAENVFEVEGMEEIVNSMTEDQKAQTYLRKLNGKLQTWWIKAE
jgi:hypothetical protein